MNAIASRPSTSTGMAYNGDPYRGMVPSRQASPDYPTPVQPKSPSSQTSSIQYARNNNYPNANAPGLYSPTAAVSSGSFIFRSFKPANSGPKEQLPFSRPLPQEAYDCILSHLKYSHLASNCEGCLTCYMRDLYSLALTSRAWEKAVRGKL